MAVYRIVLFVRAHEACLYLSLKTPKIGQYLVFLTKFDFFYSLLFAWSITFYVVLLHGASDYLPQEFLRQTNQLN